MANLLLNPPMMIAHTLKAPMPMANLLLNAAQTPKASMATTGNLWMTTPLLLIPPVMMIALKSTQQPPPRFKSSFSSTSRLKKSFSYTPPTSSPTHPLSLRRSSNHVAVPISPVLKRATGILFIFLFHMHAASPNLMRSYTPFRVSMGGQRRLYYCCCRDRRCWQNIGKIKNKKPSAKQFITFADVEGVDAAKAELLEIVLCIKGDSKYMKLGAKLPRGVLLAGPPGTGKTLLACAVAGEAGVAFFSMSASEFVEIFPSNGAARVRDLFHDARKHSPSIIFIDEIDAVGGQRGTSFNSERDQTLNQLLTEMDGFEKGATVVVIAATNRPELLDSALMRPGRFSRKVVVDKPDEDGRRKIFALYLQKVPMMEDKKVICDLVASRTPGLVGADLENIANEAVMLAARRGLC
uniref:AAA+ ATPase domain-containing protein n=2 Tax=Lactuca sativa TaxID=4236 RepID=A0A9R1VGG0_LACSA|nr:hypothetical protein LSAT_V11C500272680 [Lactuca sativa]